MKDETKKEITELFSALLDEREKSADAEASKGLRSMLKDALKSESENAPVAKPKVGDRVARIVRSLASARGDLRKAADFAENTLKDSSVAKALGTGVLEDGGFLVPEEFSQEIIELLRPRSVLRSLNPMVVPMTTGVMSIPRLAAGASANYVGESQPVNASQEKGQQLTLTWKKLASIVPISNDLLRFSSPSADTIVREDLVLSMATREDIAFIRGDGTQNTPKGLRYWAPSGNVSASNVTSMADANLLKDVDQDIKDAINALTSANVRMIRPAWIMAPRTRNFFSFLRNANGFLVYPTMSEAAPTLLGYPVGVSNNVPTNLGSGSDSEITFVDMADVVLGEATQLIIEVSNEAAYVDSNGTLQSSFSRDEMVVRAIARHDLIMRHDVSVAIKTGVILD